METLTFLFTDIEGSTALLGRLGEDDYAQMLAGHHALIRSALAAHHGREVDTQGDAFFAVFSSPRACVAAVLQVAAELLDGSGDGVWLAELAAVTDEDAVPAAISRALRLAVNPGRQVLEALLDALALQDGLIVVDSCEHLIAGCAKTAEAIVRRCPRVHLLATSREPLGIGGERIYRVPSPSLPGPGAAGPPAPGSCDAVALFADRADRRECALP